MIGVTDVPLHVLTKIVIRRDAQQGVRRVLMRLPQRRHAMSILNSPR